MTETDSISVAIVSGGFRETSPVAADDAFNPASSVPPSELVEFTPEGQFVAEFSIDAVAGSAFGIALGRSGDHLILAAVDDNFSQLDLFQVDD